jgi:hypothetical protein
MPSTAARTQSCAVINREAENENGNNGVFLLVRSWLLALGIRSALYFLNTAVILYVYLQSKSTIRNAQHDFGGVL